MKVKRAEQHLDSLSFMIKRWVKQNTYRAPDELDSDTGEYVVRAVVRKQPPPEWGILIGECVHNLRSSLDNAVYQLALKWEGGPLPEPIAKNCEFFIAETCTKFDSGWQRKLGMIDPAGQAVIKCLQPYHGGNVATHPLWRLHVLDRDDKHRLAHVAAAAFVGFGLGGKNLDLISFDLSPVPFPLKHGAELARYRATPIDPHQKMEMNLDLSFDVAFDESSLVNRSTVIDTLSAAIDCVRTVVIPNLEWLL